jgi:protein TonB
MFERIYGRPRRSWVGALVEQRTLLSLAIHAAAFGALAASGASPADVTRQVTEGIVFLAPPPTPTAAPEAADERLSFVELGGLAPAIATVIPEPLVIATLISAPTPPEVTSAGGDTAQTVVTVVETRADSVYFAEQVDSPAAYDERSAAPAYPDSLQRAGIGGAVVAQFVVDTTGRVEVETFTLLHSTDRRLTRSVRDALPNMLFRPAVLNGRKARQLVELPFRFQVVPKDSLRRDTTPPPPRY